ncbi:MAG: hypothetical protein WA863_18485, partial [Methyloceanibacter sp.]
MAINQGEYPLSQCPLALIILAGVAIEIVIPPVRRARDDIPADVCFGTAPYPIRPLLPPRPLLP